MSGQQGAPVSSPASRSALLIRTQHLLDSVVAGDQGDVAALHLDLSGFGGLNSSVGHSAADGLLAEVSADLRAALRADDLFARGSGDEFLVVSPTGVSGAVALARRLLDAVGRPRTVGGHRVTLNACVGLAVGAPGGTQHPAAASGPLTPGGLLRDADTALGEAKRAGPGTIHPFRPGREAGSGELLDLVADLAAAPTDGTLHLHYQPIVDLRSGRTVRREALLRWEHQGRLRTPDHFLPVAESHGLMRSIGTWVLTRACRDAATWRAQGDRCGVTVNVAAAQLTHDLPGQVAAALRAHRLAPQSLSVEVTETGLLADVAVAGAVLRALSEREVQILLDDFGTGYSSLSHVARLPVSGLKLDRSFVAGLPGAPQQAVVAAVAQLGASLGLATIAEGVETEGQRRMLLDLGYTHGQGWLFGRPAPAGSIPARRGSAGTESAATGSAADGAARSASTRSAAREGCPGPDPAGEAPTQPTMVAPLPTTGELLSNLVEQSHEVILTKGLDGTIWSWNPAAEQLFGWTAAEILGRSVHLIVPPHREHEIDRILAAVARGERVERHDTERVTKDGRRVLVDLSVSPLRDAVGTVIGAAAIAHDVTAQRLAEARLEDRRQDEHRQAQLLANLVQHSHDAILTKGIDGTVWSWNPAAERLYGWTAEEIVGRKVHLIAPPERHDEIDQILAALRVGETVEHHDTERVTKDGRRVVVNLSVSPLRDAEGRVVGASAIAHDVTAERLAAAELEHRSAQEAASRHLRELGELAGTCAHDVSNSLGAILITVATLRRSLPAEQAVTEPVGPLLDQLEDVTQSTGHLVAALSHYARQERGDDPRDQRCDVDAVVAELLPVLARLAGPERHLRCLTSVGTAAVGVSRAELDTVLINLVTNAVHAIEGEGTITISTDLIAADHPALHPPLRLPSASVAAGMSLGTSAVAGGRTGLGAVRERVRSGLSGGLRIAPHVRHLVRLRVTDTGCGMDESVRERAFQPLFTTRHRSSGGSGSGLGLASVDRIVTAAGGVATLTSSPGHGTTVELVLPVLHGSRIAAD
ncbi:MAG: EAL domain-containing protein [Motilibacteraceae bacterium]